MELSSVRGGTIMEWRCVRCGVHLVILPMDRPLCLDERLHRGAFLKVDRYGRFCERLLDKAA